MSRNASTDEAMAIAASVARFEAEMVAAPTAEGELVPPWRRAALAEGVGAKGVVRDHLEGGVQWQS